MWPWPTKDANSVELNPWQADIEGFLGRSLDTPPTEGRPPGHWWSHQREDEFYPQSYFKTVQAGARTNGGIRNKLQRHGYARGEFGPGGLYHNTVGARGFDGTTRVAPTGAPRQDNNSLLC
jgi:hypothetical protein